MYGDVHCVPRTIALIKGEMHAIGNKIGTCAVAFCVGVAYSRRAPIGDEYVHVYIPIGHTLPVGDCPPMAVCVL